VRGRAQRVAARSPHRVPPAATAQATREGAARGGEKGQQRAARRKRPRPPHEATADGGGARGGGPDEGGTQYVIKIQSICNQYAVQMQSEAIRSMFRCNQAQSDPIRPNQAQSGATRGHQLTLRASRYTTRRGWVAKLACDAQSSTRNGHVSASLPQGEASPKSSAASAVPSACPPSPMCRIAGTSSAKAS